ncbi:MAG TPA: hypothetical protein VHL08_05795 [Dongiaceae bacterium]|nr:hypothetical protein [Dongiaceae bacterium]
MVVSSATLAQDDTIDCSSILIKFSAPGFTQRCQQRLPTGVLSAKVQTLDAQAEDNQSFLFALTEAVRQGVILNVPGFKAAFAEYFPNYDTKTWQDGPKVGDLITAEFTAPISKIDSFCVAFARPGHHYESGYSRYSIGLACDTQDRKHVYTLLENLHLPE